VARLKLPPLTKAGTNISLMYAEALAHPGLASRATLDAWNNGGGGKTPLCTYCLLPVTCYLLPVTQCTCMRWQVTGTLAKSI
jgi:hypothetical protein